MMSSTPIRRWFRLTPGGLIAGLFVLETFLFLSDRFRWFGFGGHKGWAVLIALASVIAVMVLVVSWTALAAVFRLRMQYSIRSLLAITAAAALALGWLATEMKGAKDQKIMREVVTQSGGVPFCYKEDIGDSSGIIWREETRPTAWAWLRKLLGDDFFANVTVVSFYRTKATDVSLERIDLKRLPRLGCLDLSDTRVTDEAMAFLNGARQIECLNVSGTRVTDVGVAHLKGLTQLRCLVLRDTNVTDAGLAHLKGLTRLRVLWLAGTKITDAGLAHLKGLTQLRELWLADTKVSDAGLEHLKALSQLQDLNLTRTSVRGVGLTYLKRLSQLRKLSLIDTEVTDAGLECVEGLSQLQELRLDGTKITDAGLVHLKGLIQLQSLNIHRTKVSDAAFVHLQCLPKLRELMLDLTKATDENMEELNRALPKCRIGASDRDPEQ